MPTPTPTPVPWYQVSVGQHSDLYEPRKPLALRGAVEDPFQYLFGGTGTVLSPSFGPGDLGIFIQSGVAKAVGASTALASTTLTDTALIGVTTNFVGMWINPNRNQTKLFKILSFDSSTGTVTVTGGGMDQYSAVGDSYFILTARDSIRYTRLVARMPEFIPHIVKHFFIFFD